MDNELISMYLPLVKGRLIGRFGILKGMSMVVLGMLLGNKEWLLLLNMKRMLMSALRISLVTVSLPPLFVGSLGNLGRSSGSFRTVELDVDIGSAGFDYYALQKSEV